MKQLIKIFSFFLMIFTASCSSNGNSKDGDNKGKEGEYKTYQAACNAQDYEAAWDFVYELENKANELDGYDRFIQKNVNEYTAARDYVFDSEIQFLLANGSVEASDKVLFLLNSLPMKGKRLEEGFEGTDAGTAIVDHSLFNKDFAWYCESVNSYNLKCTKIMGLCIARNNKYLADKIVDLVKETPTSSKASGFDYIVHYTDNDRKAVRDMYEKAVESGALN